MGEFSPWHLAIVALVFVVLFGARKLPDAARGIGQSLRIFKAEMKAGVDGEPKPADTPAPQAPTASAELPQAAPAVAPTTTTPVQQPTTTS
ncbi:Sec-independent protein translocase subunit TatA [Kutzneria buriramensis]|uniref:Sec-independent protein translocase protein TatA n=1 Tax=Kutzneria buriramensis TaxID=1045776 RepID=A0A3E0HZ21_9PSEU|nr:Sec-independent protein translocase subunit TatA [Kutzneria buriramensis]REH51712.1 sec-independent protein translocase protein TatA [Kutzneria buriramensis]